MNKQITKELKKIEKMYRRDDSPRLQVLRTMYSDGVLMERANDLLQRRKLWDKLHFCSFWYGCIGGNVILLLLLGLSFGIYGIAVPLALTLTCNAIVGIGCASSFYFRKLVKINRSAQSLMLLAVRR